MHTSTSEHQPVKMQLCNESVWLSTGMALYAIANKERGLHDRVSEDD
jgi:hypothetical protein